MCQLLCLHLQLCGSCVTVACCCGLLVANPPFPLNHQAMLPQRISTATPTQTSRMERTPSRDCLSMLAAFVLGRLYVLGTAV